MKVTNFNYSKDGKKTARKVLVLEDTDTSIAGIDFSHLSKEKANNLLKSVKAPNVELNTDPYMDAYRKFNKTNMTSIKEELL